MIWSDLRWELMDETITKEEAEAMRMETIKRSEEILAEKKKHGYITKPIKGWKKQL